MVSEVKNSLLKIRTSKRWLSDFEDFAKDTDCPVQVVDKSYKVDEKGQLQDLSAEYDYCLQKEVLPNQQCLGRLDTGEYFVQYVRMIRSWKDGVENGMRVKLNKDGTPKEVVWVKDGVRNGMGIVFCEDGVKKYETWENDNLRRLDLHSHMDAGWEKSVLDQIRNLVTGAQHMSRLSKPPRRRTGRSDHPMT